MKSIFFTKPKENTLNCLKFMIEQGEEILAVVVDDKNKYFGSEFLEYCKTNDINICNNIDISNIYIFRNEIEMIYSHTFPKLISEDIIKMASICAINFHSSPLPKYRGVFGYNFAFLNGEREWGVSVHKLDGKFDTGDIIEVSMFDYDFNEGNINDLVKKTERYMLNLFKKTYLRFKNGENIETFKQSVGKYYSRQDFNEAKQILISDDADIIERKIKAFWCPPYEGAYIQINDKRYTLINKEIIESIGVFNDKQ